MRAQRESNQRESAPGIRVSLRETSLAPVLLQGPAYKGRPWPFKPLAASMRLAPFRNDSVRPPEGGVWSCLKVLYSFPDGSHASRGNHQCAKRQDKPPGNSEPESPSGGRVEVLRRGTSRMDAVRGVKGHGRPLYAGRRSGTGRREVWPQVRPGCRGALLFGYFLLGKQEKVTRRKGEKGKIRFTQWFRK